MAAATFCSSLPTPPGLEPPPGLLPPPGLNLAQAELVDTVDKLSRAIGIMEKEMVKNPAAGRRVELAQRSGYPPARPGRAGLIVTIRGLPNDVLNETMMVAILQQAGLIGATLDVWTRQGNPCGEARVSFRDRFAVEKCVKHFQGCQWDQSDTFVTVQIHEQALRPPKPCRPQAKPSVRRQAPCRPKQSGLILSPGGPAFVASMLNLDSPVPAFSASIFDSAAATDSPVLSEVDRPKTCSGVPTAFAFDDFHGFLPTKGFAPEPSPASDTSTDVGDRDGAASEDLQSDSDRVSGHAADEDVNITKPEQKEDTLEFIFARAPWRVHR